MKYIIVLQIFYFSLISHSTINNSTRLNCLESLRNSIILTDQITEIESSQNGLKLRKKVSTTYKSLSQYQETKLIRHDFINITKPKQGGFFILQPSKPGKNKWRPSGYNTNGFNYLGSPWKVLESVGCKLSKFFNIEIFEVKIFNSEKIETWENFRIPDVELINLKISDLNKKLIKNGYTKIPFTFYDSPNSINDFTTRFVLKNEIAYNDPIHDFSYHFNSILLTEDILFPAKERLSILNQFSEFLESEIGHKFKTREYSAFFNLFNKIVGTEIDLISGGLADRFSVNGYNPIESLDVYLEYVNYGYFRYGKESKNQIIKFEIPITYCKKILKLILSDATIYKKLFNLSSYEDQQNLLKIEGHLKVNPDFYENDFSDIFSSWIEFRTKSESKNLSISEPIVKDGTALNKYLLNRVKELEQSINFFLW